jgi:hypothetical protein
VKLKISTHHNIVNANKEEAFLKGKVLSIENQLAKNSSWQRKQK